MILGVLYIILGAAICTGFGSDIPHHPQDIKNWCFAIIGIVEVIYGAIIVGGC